MTNININLDLPEKIVNGLNDGTFERFGGVIRNAKTKKIVAFLKENSENNDSPSQAPNIPGLPDVIANQQLMMGLQIANLAVSAAGFVITYQKLINIEKILLKIESNTETIIENQVWQDKKQVMMQLSPMISAFESLKLIDSISNHDIYNQKLLDADSKIDSAREYFHGMMKTILAEKAENDRQEELAFCYRAWVMASHGGICIMDAFGEIPAAIKRVEKHKSENALFGEQLRHVMSDIARRVEYDSHCAEPATYLTELGHQVVGVHSIIKGQELLLKFAQSTGISLTTLDAEKPVSDKPYLVYLVEHE